MTDPRKIIKKIRHQFKRLEKPEPLWKKFQAEARAREYMADFWERDKKVVRDANFKKALIGLEEYRERQREEKERQEQIALDRLKNLKKARRVLKRSRENAE